LERRKLVELVSRLEREEDKGGASKSGVRSGDL
jgi:hypothetical protein